MRKINRRSLLAAAAAPLAGPLAGASQSTDPVRERVVDAIDRLLGDREDARTVFKIVLIWGGAFPSSEAAAAFLETHWGPSPDLEPLPEAATAPAAPAPTQAELDARYAAMLRGDLPESVFYVDESELTAAHMRHLRELKPEDLNAEQLAEIKRCFSRFEAEELSDSGGGVWFHRFLESLDVKAGEGITVTTRIMPWVPVPAAEAVSA